MKPIIPSIVYATVACLLLLGTAALAQGTVSTFEVSLDTSQSIPAPVIDNATPSGNALVAVNAATREVTVTGSYANMSSDVVGAHLHGPAAAGNTAIVLVPLQSTGRNTGTFSGTGVLTAANLEALIRGLTYINIRTVTNTAGELRGQIENPSLREFNIALEASQEIPSPTVDGASPSGSATVFVNTNTGNVVVVGSYNGMTSNVAAAHIHGPAKAGETAGVIVPLAVSGGTSGTVSGGATLTGANLAALFAGRAYVNVHTANNGPGEIRGQIVDKSIREFEITLDAAQEIPPPVLSIVDPADPDAVVIANPSGDAVVIVDVISRKLWVTGSYDGATSDVVAAHIHGPARAGESAGVIVPLDVTGGASGAISGIGSVSETQLTTLLTGQTYINVHTVNNGAGEIRGQVSDKFVRDFGITLDSSQEIPAPTVGDANPSGNAVVTVDALTGALSVSGTYDGMTSNVAAAHIHGPARSGQAAGVIVPLQVSGGVSGTISGTATISGMNMAALFAGHTYVNVHTANNGPGEIRGQVTDESIREFAFLLDPSQEIPAPNVGGANPRGDAFVTVDAVTGKLYATGNYEGMTSNVVAAHIHGPASVGQTAGVLVPLTVSGGASGTFSGTGSVTGMTMAEVFAGRTYINVHTANNGPGEIRGQVTDKFVREFAIALEVAQEIPAPDLSSTDPDVVVNPEGNAVVIVDTLSDKLLVVGSYTGMTSDVVAAHIHAPARIGERAGVIIPLQVSGGASGIISGASSLSGTNMAALFAGHTYVNVHTTNNGSGEIRGQVVDRFIREFSIALAASQEVPPPVLDGASPEGDASVIVDAITGKLSVTGSYEGMTSDVVAAHIHGPAGIGKGAGVIIPLQTSGGTSGLISGTSSVSGANMAALFSGRTYVNVHTVNNGPGEIRGQVSDAFILKFDALLDSAQEIPAPNVAGFDPRGSALVTADSVTGKVVIAGDYVGATSNVVAAHLHGLANPGEAAGVLIPLTVSGGATGTFSGLGNLTESNLDGLINNLTYINVHTQINGPGEIRGQVLAPGAPAPFLPFIDDFADGSTSDDAPVSIVSGERRSTITLLDGDMLLTKPSMRRGFSLGSTTVTKAGHPVQSGDVTAQAIVRVSDDFAYAGIYMRGQLAPPKGDGGAYFGNIRGDGYLTTGSFTGDQPFLVTPLDPVNTDVVLQVSAVGAQVTTTAWAADNPAETYSLTFIDTAARPDGFMGQHFGHVGSDAPGSGGEAWHNALHNEASAIFRSFQVLAAAAVAVPDVPDAPDQGNGNATPTSPAQLRAADHAARTLAIEINAGSGLPEIIIATVLGHQYEVECSDDLVTFTTMFGEIQGTGELMKFQDPDLPNGAKYFRVREREASRSTKIHSLRDQRSLD